MKRSLSRFTVLTLALVAALLPGCIAPTPCPDPPTDAALTPTVDLQWLTTLLESSPPLAAVAADAEKYRLQLLVSEVVETDDGPIRTAMDAKKHGVIINYARIPGLLVKHRLTSVATMNMPWEGKALPKIG